MCHRSWTLSWPAEWPSVSQVWLCCTALNCWSDFLLIITGEWRVQSHNFTSSEAKPHWILVLQLLLSYCLQILDRRRMEAMEIAREKRAFEQVLKIRNEAAEKQRQEDLKKRHVRMIWCYLRLQQVILTVWIHPHICILRKDQFLYTVPCTTFHKQRIKMCLCLLRKSKLVTARHWIWIQIDTRMYVHDPPPAVPKSRALPWHSHSWMLNI